MATSKLKITRRETPNLTGLSMLLYGHIKVGKTTVAANFTQVPPLIVACHPNGADALVNMDICYISTLNELESIAAEIAASDYRSIVLDDITLLINHEGRQGAGAESANGRQVRGEAVYRDLVRKVDGILNRLFAANKIVIATGHDRAVETLDNTGAKMTEIRPDANQVLSDYLLRTFSIVGYCYSSPQGPMMITRPTIKQATVNREPVVYHVLAGDRFNILPNPCALKAETVRGNLAKLLGNGGKTAVTPLTPEAGK